MKTLAMVAIVLACGQARAEYCVGTSCAGGAAGWHMHGCWDLSKLPDGGPTSHVGCFAKVAECWDAEDGTCEILNDWGYRLSADRCATAKDKIEPKQFCSGYVKDELAKEKMRRDAEKKEKAIAAAYGNSIAPAGAGIGQPSATPTVQQSPTVASPPPPRPVAKNPWTPQTSAPLQPLGGVMEVDFTKKTPCTICVEFTAPQDTVSVAAAVPQHAAAATAIAQDAATLAHHVAAQTDMTSVAGIPPPAGWDEYAATPVHADAPIVDSSSTLAPTDDAAIAHTPRYFLDHPSTGDEIRDAADALAKQQPGFIASLSQRAAGQIVGDVADLGEHAVRESPPVSLGEVAVKYVVQVTPYTSADALRDSENVGIDWVNRAVVSRVRKLFPGASYIELIEP